MRTRGSGAAVAAAARALDVQPGRADATLTHPFHAYPARLHPAIARTLVDHVVQSHGAGARLLDPCCGSGTVLVESMVAGLRAAGTDLSPLALALASLKTTRTDSRTRRAMVQRAYKVMYRATVRVNTGEPAPVPPGEATWFDPRTLSEVSALAAEIDRLAAGFERDALRMLLSSILVKLSRRVSDTDARWVDRPQSPGAAFAWFVRKAKELESCLSALSHALPAEPHTPVVAQDDLRTLATVADGSVDAIVTSPPYAGTYDYADHHARRYAWLHMDPAPITEGEFAARRAFEADPMRALDRYKRDLAQMARVFTRVLAPGGVAFVVVGDGAVESLALRADAMLSEALGALPLAIAGIASQDRPNYDRDAEPAFTDGPRREHIVVLERRGD